MNIVLISFGNVDIVTSDPKENRITPLGDCSMNSKIAFKTERERE